MNTSETTARTVDADHPWLGLSPFTEATQAFFFGRDEEIRDLFLRVREQPLTVLYGQSGLGKTSLLGAGLIPKLKVEGFRPAVLRLGYDEYSPQLLHQVLFTVTGPSWQQSGSIAPTVHSTLWELYHHIPTRPPELASVPPVVIFDQFEEIFTLGGSPTRQAEARELLVQLADLIENRPPAAVQDQWRADRKLAREYDLSSSPVRVLITLREDYLSQLESWKKLLPSLMRNRMGLELLNGAQALEAVVRPARMAGRRLVGDEVGAQIVRFVARRPPETPLAEIGAVPPLLSLICDELNEARLAAGASEITSGQVAEQSADILQNFYVRSFDGLPAQVRRFVERRMVTIGGYRNSVVREDAIEHLVRRGVADPSAAIDQLIQRRLLSAEERGGVQRLEITHDVLAPLVIRSRDERQSREDKEAAEQQAREAQAAAARQSRALRRSRGLAALFAVLAVVSLVTSLWAWRAQHAAVEATQNALSEKKRADEAAKMAENAQKNAEAEARHVEALLREASGSDFATAQARFADGKWQEGMAYLGRSFHYNPRNAEACDALWLAGMYGTRNARQMQEEIVENEVPLIRRNPDGTWSVNDDPARRVVADLALSVTGEDNLAAMNRLIGEPLCHPNEVKTASFSLDGTRIVTSSGSMARIWDLVTGLPIGEPLRHPNDVNTASFSPDGTRIVTSSGSMARIWDFVTGRPIGEPLRHPNDVNTVSFSPDGTRIVTSSDATARIWDAVTGRPIGAPLHHADVVSTAAFSPDSRRIVSASWDRTARMWDVMTGGPIGEPLTHIGRVNSAVFNSDGTRIVTASADETACVWDAVTSRPIGVPLRHHQWVFSASFSADDGRIVTTSGYPKTARVWDAVTGQPVGEPLGHEDGVNTALFSPDGTRIVTASDDKSARVWDAITGRLIGEPLRQKDRVLGATFNSDGTRIVTASADNTARVYDCAPAEPSYGDILTKVASVLSGAVLDEQPVVLRLLSNHERLTLWKEIEPLLAERQEWLFLVRTVFPQQPYSTISPRSTMTIREAATQLILTRRDGCMQEAASIDPLNPLLAIARAAPGDANDILSGLERERGVAELPDDAAICREAAEMLIEQKDGIRAARALDKAAKLDPQHPDLARLRAALQKLDGTGAADSTKDSAPPKDDH